jgi:hypothetical protein
MALFSWKMGAETGTDAALWQGIKNAASHLFLGA